MPEIRNGRAFSLLSAQAVRERAQRMLALGLDDRLPHFAVDLERLDEAVDLVIETTRQNYPSLDMPFHSRWRHFVFDGDDRWAAIDKEANWRDDAARGARGVRSRHRQRSARCWRRAAWRYRDPATGRASAARRDWRSRASHVRRRHFLVESGRSVAGRRRRPDAPADAIVGDGLQVSRSNPLVGMTGRADLLRRLGALVAAKPEIFGRNDRRGRAACSIISRR